MSVHAGIESGTALESGLGLQESFLRLHTPVSIRVRVRATARVTVRVKVAVRVRLTAWNRVAFQEYGHH